MAQKVQHVAVIQLYSIVKPESDKTDVEAHTVVLRDTNLRNLKRQVRETFRD